MHSILWGYKAVTCSIIRLCPKIQWIKSKACSLVIIASAICSPVVSPVTFVYPTKSSLTLSRNLNKLLLQCCNFTNQLDTSQLLMKYYYIYIWCILHIYLVYTFLINISKCHSELCLQSSVSCFIC